MIFHGMTWHAQIAPPPLDDALLNASLGAQHLCTGETRRVEHTKVGPLWNFGRCRTSVAGLSWKKRVKPWEDLKILKSLALLMLRKESNLLPEPESGNKVESTFCPGNLNQENPVRFSWVYWCRPPQCSYPQSNIPSTASWDSPEINGHFNGATGQPSNQLHITWGVSIKTCSITKR